ncbi:MAG: NAD(P)H-hydrate dehydratase [Ignavibacteria bacterium]|nr:NAD(P)H-hydrate dehydratase [Ignavibacteria bacterium]
MIPLYNSNAISKIDALYISDAKVPALHLMETAATNAWNAIALLLPKSDSCNILVACGGGNNGGDGLVIARLLSAKHNVTVLFDSEADKISESTRTNYSRLPDGVLVFKPTILLDDINRRLLDNLNTEFLDNIYTQFDVVIDALIGVGGSHLLRGPASEICNALNNLHSIKIAIDVPTGVNANTGQAHANAFHADHTVTMVGAKPGLYLSAGKNVAGKIHPVSIGERGDLETSNSSGAILTMDDVRTFLPSRTGNTSKFSFGRVCVIAGSQAMRGAPALTAHAAMLAGAGLVELHAPAIHPLTPREVICYECAPTNDGTISKRATESLNEAIGRCTTLAIGPGLGRNSETIQLIGSLINSCMHDVKLKVSNRKKYVVLDADGLQSFSHLEKPLSQVIITPHVGEFARISGIGVDDIIDDPLTHSMNFAEVNGCIVHLKGATSVTTNGVDYFLTVNGNAGLSKAGSGDVLTGIIAAMLAQNLEPLVAAAVASYLHAACADVCAQSQAMETIMPSDIIQTLPKIFPL